MTMDAYRRSELSQETFDDPVEAYSKYAGGELGEGLRRWIPAHMRAGLARYILLGILPGSFLRSVLQTDLIQATAKADEVNREQLYKYVLFLVNYAPAGCCGSLEAIQQWSVRGGLVNQPARGGAPC
ncbi:hypothetical protein [Thalassobacter stenotrophicus]|uniref:Uncharacterized protein n=2 Tax=Thalassobacter stenotrophicus TaxID=266809 RepID=A0A0P1FF51_9RHOB|nr:hypothetical protein [Thalassobacter stenotrophicus]CUH60271.1 hypothetical protein THS5294_01560 [Thalassobacter stenotrophicus]SHI71617.1 hypothetical protein SAMN02744035_01351 [Thalassobacter stenotrophicus DSM 16310]